MTDIAQSTGSALLVKLQGVAMDYGTPALGAGTSAANYVGGYDAPLALFVVHGIITIVTGVLTILLIVLNIRSRMRRDAKDYETGQQ